VYRENIPTTCGACHADERKAYLESIHATAMHNGPPRRRSAPTVTASTPSPGAQDPNSRVSVAQVTKTCSSLPRGVADQRKKYGLPENRVVSYQDSFHGLAARGGNLTAANCASCHGFHDVRPSTDPKSSIYPSNLPATCGKCHPGASENFARGSVHVSVTKQEAPILYYVRTFYLLIDRRDDRRDGGA